MNQAGFSIRPATLDDAAMLSAIATRTFIDLVNTLYSPDDVTHLHNAFPIDRMRQEIQEPCQSTLLIFPRGGDTCDSACGYVMLRDGSIRPGDASAAAEDYLEVKRLYVDAEFHGKFASHLLMEKAMEIVQQKNRKIVWLSTSPVNVRAQKFYHKHGFEVTGEKSYDHGSGFEPDLVRVLWNQMT